MMSEARDPLNVRILTARHERAKWQAGRKACRDFGTSALNPYSLRSTDHHLWAAGFELERSLLPAPFTWLKAE